MEKTLAKYKIGLAVLMLFAIAMTVLVLIQASSTKSDTQTNNSASTIADTLNNYVDTNDTIPATLAEAGVKSVPSAVNYTKISDSSYKFCVTYKGNSSGFDASGVATNLLTGQLDPGSGGSSDNAVLTIDTTYHKGANCQTVTPSFITPTPLPCEGTNGAQCISPTNPSITLCDYGPVQSGGCSLRCKTAVSGTTPGTGPKVIDGTVSNITGSGTSLVLTISDTKNVTHQISVNSGTVYDDSSCTTLDSSNIQSGDEVRIVVDSAVTYPASATDHVLAAEIDDLSY